jgi:hypothetical protein
MILKRSAACLLSPLHERSVHVSVVSMNPCVEVRRRTGVCFSTITAQQSVPVVVMNLRGDAYLY